MKHRSTESSSVVAIVFFNRVWFLNTAPRSQAPVVAKWTRRSVNSIGEWLSVVSCQARG